MKQKVIFYGWLVSIPCMMAGLGTIEWAIENGDGNFIAGLLLFSYFIVFSCLLCRNTKGVEKEMEQFDHYFERFFQRLSDCLTDKTKKNSVPASRLYKKSRKKEEYL